MLWETRTFLPQLLSCGINLCRVKEVCLEYGNRSHKIDANLLKIHHWPGFNMAKCWCKWGGEKVDPFIANKSELQASAHKYHSLSWVLFYCSWWKLLHLFMSSVDTSLCKSQLAHVLIECADPALVLIFFLSFTLSVSEKLIKFFPINTPKTVHNTQNALCYLQLHTCSLPEFVLSAL